MAVCRQNQNYILRFPDLADFLLDFRHCNIQCHLLADIPPETVRHLFLDHVIPRFLAHQGNLVLHASAVVLPNGAGLAFLGKSGWGKSTIASSFYRRGAKLISDDGLLLEEKAGLLIGFPAYSGSRLWQDSADSVFSDQPDLTRVSHYSAKKRLILSGDPLSFSGVELHAIFLLNDPSEKKLSRNISIERIVGADAIMAIIGRAFLLDVEDMVPVAKQFSSASRIASTYPAVYSLRYPREYELLPELHAATQSIVNAWSGSERKAGP